MPTPIRFLTGAQKDFPEADRLPGIPHPREMLSLLGAATAEAEFLGLHTSGKMHHAFLLTGPEGVGKASFAYRAARFLLRSPPEKGMDALFGDISPPTMETASSDRIAQLVANDAHPDLGVLRRRYDAKTKKIRSEISIDDTRDVLSLFEKTAAFGGWRVIIIDAADDLNAASANAILKTLEEPPERAIFFLVAHRPDRLLPTIRSRCRTLRFEPLEASDLGILLAAFGGAAGQEGTILARAGGSIRQALRLREAGLSGFLARIETVLAALPKPNAGDVDRIAEACRTGSEGEEALADFGSAVELWLHTQISTRAAAGQRADQIEPFAQAWATLMDKGARVDALNLDRRALVHGTIDDLAALVSTR